MLSTIADLQNAVSPLPQTVSSGTQQQLIQTGLNVLFGIIGAMSLLLIVIAGFKYVVSHGDTRVIEQAKNTILYAIIGLIVSISALAIVNFVINSIF